MSATTPAPAAAIAARAGLHLPGPLEPWRAWLALLAPELALPFGQLLLLLHPLLGRMNAAVRSPDSLPAGVGDIVRRGPYERLLISEWAYADAEPDEFIRRAANNELLFTGPQAEAQRRSRVCIALFDAGPAQLGEPRLAQLALYILLARRAHEAGAEFRWGTLQAPGRLHADTGRAAIQTLLHARTLASASAFHLDEWDAHLAGLDAREDGALRDCWQLGPPHAPAVRMASAHVSIAHSLLDDQLHLEIRQNQATRSAQLSLPPAALGVRLLRHPFDTPADKNRVAVATATRLSLKQAPRFAVNGRWLASARLDGGASVFHVPQSTQAPPGRTRQQAPPEQGAILGANVFHKGLASVVAHGDKLSFAGFPGLWSQATSAIDRPPAEAFRAPPGMGRWLPTFYLKSTQSKRAAERVLMLDIEQQLVCWEMTVSPRRSDNRPPAFVSVASRVVGAEQFGRTLMYATAVDSAVRIYRWPANEDAAILVDTLHIKACCTRLLFGGPMWGTGAVSGLLAMQTGATTWEINNVGSIGGRSVLELGDDALVVGVAFPKGAMNGTDGGLVVLHPDKKSIQLRTAHARFDLVKSELAIGQVALDADGAHLAWLVKANGALHVRRLHGDTLLLRAVAEEAAGDA